MYMIRWDVCGCQWWVYVADWRSDYPCNHPKLRNTCFATADDFFCLLTLMGWQWYLDQGCASTSYCPADSISQSIRAGRVYAFGTERTSQGNVVRGEQVSG